MLISIKISINAFFFQAHLSLNCYFSCSKLLKCQQLAFMSRKNFMRIWLEHRKSFITSGPGWILLRHLQDPMKSSANVGRNGSNKTWNIFSENFKYTSPYTEEEGKHHHLKFYLKDLCEDKNHFILYIYIKSRPTMDCMWTDCVTARVRLFKASLAQWVR